MTDVTFTIRKPKIIDGDEASLRTLNNGLKVFMKLSFDIILAVSLSEIKRMKVCEISRSVRLKLEDI